MNKTIVRASWVAVMLLLVSAFGNAACTGGGSLSGWYGMLVSGSGSNAGQYIAGAVYFDGSCNISGSNITGAVAGPGSYTTSGVTGTYGENADGSFNLSLNFAGQTNPQTYTIGVSESGNKARGLESDNTASATIDLQSQLTTLTSGYNTASLAGTYAASCWNGSVAHLNYVTFDGKGNLTGLDYYDISGSVSNAPYSGSYTVNSDGTFSGALTGNYSAYMFNGVIDNGVSEIDYIYENGGAGVLSCVGKQSTTNTLSGYYGMLVSGNAQYFSGSLYFDGVSAVTATNINGGGSVYGNTNATGTYSTNADGTVTITLNLASPAVTQTYVVGVSEAGSEAVGVETDGAAVATIDLQSQLQLPSTPYTVASLNGTYAASCAGGETDLNWVTYDGNGNISGVDAFNDGSYSSSPYTGTYTVSPDGTVTGHFADNTVTGVDYSIFTLTGVLDNGTSEMEFTYDQSGVGGVVACIGESTYGPVGANPVAATPTFNPAPGAFGSSQPVTLSDTTAGAVIHYTTNGATPTASSPVYSNGTPIQVTSTTTIQAIAVASGYNNSALAAGTYFLNGLPTAAAPTFNPAPGPYTSAQSVALSDTTPGAVIYYTTNGTPPGQGSSVYSPGSPIPVTATTTIEAIAVASGYNNSPVTSGTYTITPPSGTVVNLSSYYNVYGIASSGKPAKNGGFDGQSGDAYNSATLGTSATYKGMTFVFGPANALDGVSSETIPLPAGSYGQLYLLGAASYGAQTNQTFVVTYTDKTTSTFTQTLSDWWSSQGYSGETVVAAPSNIILSNGTVDAQAVNLYGYTFNLIAGKTVASIKLPSNRQTAFLAIGLSAPLPTAATPTFSVTPGTYTSPQSVALSDTTPGAIIYYTTNGTTPSSTSSVYNPSSPIQLSATTTIMAIAVATGYTASAVASGTYTINLPTAATPTFSVAPGTYTSAQSVALSDTTPGAIIHYTTNGTTPSSTSSVYNQGSRIQVSATTTIEAIAMATGYNNSAVATGVYTIGAPTPIVPYIQVNGASWQQIATVTVAYGSTVNLGPQPITGGSWSWTGPNGYTSTSRQINSIPLSTGTNTFVATYTNTSGIKSTQTFTITVTGAPTPIVPYIQVNGGSWQQTASVTVSYGSTVNLGPQPLTGGSWSWTGPRGYTSTSRQINRIPLSYGTNTYVATYTNASGIKSTQTFTITIR